MEKSKPMRRLVSLVMLLVLVLILIQQASDPNKVAKVGKAIGLFQPDGRTSLEASRVQGLASDSDEQRDTSDQDNLATKQVSMFEELQLHADDQALVLQQSLWEYLLRKLNNDSLFSLAKATFSESLDGSLRGVLETINGFHNEVSHWATLNSDSNRAAKNEQLAIQNALELLDAARSSESRAERSLLESRPFRLALDRVLARQFGDGQIWMQKEQVPALRTWQRIREFRSMLEQKHIRPGEIPNIEVSQLVSSSNSVYRCVPTRFAGTIAGIDQRSGKLNVEGWPSVSYRVWWLKPSGLSNQPVSVYVPIDLEPSRWESDRESTIEIIGFFTKKVAYAAERGPEVAPVLFAAAIQRGVSTLDSHGAFEKWLAKHRVIKSWIPPIDYVSPHKLLIQSAQSIQSKFFEPPPGGTNLPSDLELALLPEASKFALEIKLLGNAGQEWKLSEGLGIGRLKGIATKIRRWKLTDLERGKANPTALEILRRSERTEFYEIQVEAKPVADSLVDRTSQIRVLANKIPSSWNERLLQSELVLWQPVVIHGITIDSTDQRPESTIVADSVSWQWTGSEPNFAETWEPKLTNTESYLLSKGWDLSWRDKAEEFQSPAKPLHASEMDGLYSLIRITCDKIDNSIPIPGNPKSIVDLVKQKLAKGQTQKISPGVSWLHCDAKVVRVTRIFVESPHHQANLGSDRYYQLDCMADIGNVTFEIPTEGEPISYAGEYPVTCLVRELPDWFLALAMNHNQSPTQTSTEDVFFPGTNVHIRGWFYRFWSYHTQEMQQSLGRQHRQVTPLVVAQSLQRPTPKTSAKPTQVVNNMVWLIGMAGLAGVWWFVRRLGKRDTKPPLKFNLKGKLKDSSGHKPLGDTYQQSLSIHDSSTDLVE